jgi:hypothetical protein
MPLIKYDRFIDDLDPCWSDDALPASGDIVVSYARLLKGGRH